MTANPKHVIEPLTLHNWVEVAVGKSCKSLTSAAGGRGCSLHRCTWFIVHNHTNHTSTWRYPPHAVKQHAQHLHGKHQDSRGLAAGRPWASSAIQHHWSWHTALESSAHGLGGQAEVNGGCKYGRIHLAKIHPHRARERCMLATTPGRTFCCSLS